MIKLRKLWIYGMKNVEVFQKGMIYIEYKDNV